MTKLVVGLGNIGKEYENTNHNMGFMAIDNLANKLGVKFSKNMCNSHVGQLNFNGEKVVFAKPTTFMNASGVAVKSLIEKFGIDISKDLLIISDDIDLDVGKIRIKPFGSAGTHNGLKSVIFELETEKFARLRIGIGKPSENVSLIDFVLSKIHDKQGIMQGVENASLATEMFISGESLDKIMQKFN